MGYSLRKTTQKVLLPNKAIAHWAYIRVLKGKRSVLRFYVPCRSNLYRVITGFFFYGSYRDELWSGLTEETLSILRTMVRHRRDYRFWKKIRGIMDTKGIDEAFSLVKEKVQIIRLAEMVAR